MSWKMARIKVRGLAEAAGIDYPTTVHGYPHFYYLDDTPSGKDGWVAYDLEGERVRQFLDYAASCDLTQLPPGSSTATCLHTPRGTVEGALTCVTANHYRLSIPARSAGLAAIWLRDLSDGYVAFDEQDARDLPCCASCPDR